MALETRRREPRRRFEGPETWTTLAPNEGIVFDRETCLLDNFTLPESPDERHAVYYEYEENVSASNEQRIYGDDKCIHLLRKQEDPAKAANKLSDITAAVAAVPSAGPPYRLRTRSLPLMRHEYS